MPSALRGRAIARALLMLATPIYGGAQGITRDNYHELLPPLPRIVGQTRASAALRLFGDTSAPGYRDVDPADGIDDTRAKRLTELAVRFAPVMRRNNESVPRHPFTVLGDPALLVDSWLNGRRIASERISLGTSVTLAGQSAAADGAPSESDAARLTMLLAELGPAAARIRVARPEGDVEHVLFFDMPGSEAQSWRAEAKKLGPRASHLFAHPFIAEREDSAGPRYWFVIQYWLYYPFNNAVNDHEGDWEHVNVIVSTRDLVRRSTSRDFTGTAMTADAVRRLLDATQPLDDETAIAAVDYYFHDHVLTLDYVAERIVPDSATERHLHAPRYVWEDVNYVSEVIHRRRAHAGGRFATHPFIFIGGNNKGPDELRSVVPRFKGSFRRNSDASFPFPGTWQTLGPFGITEKVYGDVVPRVTANTSSDLDGMIDDTYWRAYGSAEITLLPDWERLVPLVTARPDVRARWGWMLLPIYWGFPATASLGAGMIKRTDLGDIAPLTPTFHSTWNRIGPSQRHSRYTVRVLRTPVSPTTPWAVIRNGWGVLNVPLAAWGLMPGYNVALVELAPWLGGVMHIVHAPPARTFTNAALPHRFTTAGQGVFFELGGRKFADLLPRRDPMLPTDAADGALYRNVQPGTRLWFDLFFRDRFALENTFSWHTSTIGYDRVENTTIRRVSGRLTMQQLTGGIRYSPYSVLDESVQLYLRTGYGWLQYRADRLTAGTVQLASAPVRRGYLPPVLPSRHWWPNTWYGGAGLELFAPREKWILGRLGAGVRIEGSLYLNKLSFDTASGRGDITARRGDVSMALIFGW